MKATNLAGDPRCVLSVATHEFDLVLEGTAAPSQPGGATRWAW